MTIFSFELIDHFSLCIQATEGETFKKEGIPIASKKCQFTYDEVVEITKNFETEIGKGGFGAVYHGYMKDGTQVAVKMLSPSSTQGPREFQTEVCWIEFLEKFSARQMLDSLVLISISYFFVCRLSY